MVLREDLRSGHLLQLLLRADQVVIVGASSRVLIAGVRLLLADQNMSLLRGILSCCRHREFCLLLGIL